MQIILSGINFSLLNLQANFCRTGHRLHTFKLVFARNLEVYDAINFFNNKLSCKFFIYFK